MKDLDKAIRLRKERKLQESNEILLHLVNKYPNDATINYQCAWSFDTLGLEKSAIQYYEKAISIGLPDEDLRSAYLGLGSTYRTLGQYKESQKVFKEGLSKFPQDRAMEVFYAMTLYNLTEHSKAMEILLNSISKTSLDKDINKYKKAIEFYADKLDEIW